MYETAQTVYALVTNLCYCDYIVRKNRRNGRVKQSASPKFSCTQLMRQNQKILWSDLEFKLRL